MIDKKVKFIHVFWHNDLKFNANVVKMIEDEKNQFDVDNHYYLTPYKEVYEELKNLTNRVSIVCEDKPKSAKIINKYSKFCDYFIIHSMTEIHNAIFIKRKNLKKIVWRTWGHDVKYVRNDSGFLKNFIKSLLELKWKKMVKSFYGVGIANSVDVIALKEVFGTLNCFRLSYISKEMQLEAKNESNSYGKDKGCINILLGHSGHAVNNHIKILKTLSKYFQNNIKIYLILSYGNPDYIKKVEHEVKQFYNNKCIIIKEFLPCGEYVKLLSKIDVAILPGKSSYALGNISTLLKLNKKIYLSKDGIIAKAFINDSLHFSFVEDIEKMQFSDFIKPVDNSKIKSSMKPITYEQSVELWKNLFNKIEYNS